MFLFLCNNLFKYFNVIFSGSFAENVIKMMFNRKAVIEAEPPENVKESDQVLEHAIECGAEDVEQAESNTYIVSILDSPFQRSIRDDWN